MPDFLLFAEDGVSLLNYEACEVVPFEDLGTSIDHIFVIVVNGFECFCFCLQALLFRELPFLVEG